MRLGLLAVRRTNERHQGSIQRRQRSAGGPTGWPWLFKWRQRAAASDLCGLTFELTPTVEASAVSPDSYDATLALAGLTALAVAGRGLSEGLGVIGERFEFRLPGDRNLKRLKRVLSKPLALMVIALKPSDSGQRQT